MPQIKEVQQQQSLLNSTTATAQDSPPNNLHKKRVSAIISTFEMDDTGTMCRAQSKISLNPFEISTNQFDISDNFHPVDMEISPNSSPVSHSNTISLHQQQQQQQQQQQHPHETSTSLNISLNPFGMQVPMQNPETNNVKSDNAVPSATTGSFAEYAEPSVTTGPSADSAVSSAQLKVKKADTDDDPQPMFSNNTPALLSFTPGNQSYFAWNTTETGRNTIVEVSCDDWLEEEWGQITGYSVIKSEVTDVQKPQPSTVADSPAETCFANEDENMSPCPVALREEVGNTPAVDILHTNPMTPGVKKETFPSSEKTHNKNKGRSFPIKNTSEGIETNRLPKSDTGEVRTKESIGRNLKQYLIKSGCSLPEASERRIHCMEEQICKTLKAKRRTFNQLVKKFKHYQRAGWNRRAIEALVEDILDKIQACKEKVKKIIYYSIPVSDRPSPL